MPKVCLWSVEEHMTLVEVVDAYVARRGRLPKKGDKKDNWFVITAELAKRGIHRKGKTSRGTPSR